MEWLKQILNDENLTAEQKQEAIQKELPKTFIPKTKYNEKVEELNATVLKMDELNKQVNTLSNSSEEAGTLKVELEKIKGEFDLFKTDSEKRVITIQKKQAIQNKLKDAGAHKGSSDLLVTLFDLDSIQIDDNGKISNWDEQFKPILESRAPLFAQTQISGDKPNNGKLPEVGTYQIRYKEAMDKGNRREAIKIKQEAFAEGEII